MKRLKLAVSGITPYMGRLAEYMQNNGPEYLEVLECVKQAELAPFLEMQKPDILLCESKKLAEGLSGEEDHILPILLSDTKNPPEKEIPTIFRYQDGASILRQVFLSYGQRTQQKLDVYSQSEDFEMAAVYAPGGHELQLAFSLSYASVCGESKKTLYLNLSEFSGMLPLTRQEEGESLGDLIYGIRQSKDKFLFYLESVLRHTTRYDYILAPNNPQDLYAFTEKDLACLLELLKSETDYDAVVWNLGSFNQLAEEIWMQCGKVFCVVKESSFGTYQKKELESFLNKEANAHLKNKLHYVNPQAGAGMFAQGEGIFKQLQEGEFVNQIKRLAFREGL